MPAFSGFRSRCFILCLVSFVFNDFILWAEMQAQNSIHLPPLFGDNMVLQQGRPVPVWGRSKPGEKIAVRLCGQKKSGFADKQGKWNITIGPFQAGGPFEMTVSGSETISFKNVMIGEVWVCSGQSNMDMTVDTIWGRVLDYEKEVSEAIYPNIRFFNVDHIVSGVPLEEPPSTTLWTSCTPETVKGFSATAYFFGRHIHKQMNVPVGLVRSAWGGTHIESWMSLESQKGIPFLKETIRKNEDTLNSLEQKKERYPDELKQWNDALKQKDLGYRGQVEWSDPNLDTKDWKIMQLPQPWEKTPGLEEFDGVIWFKKEFNAPKNWAQRKLTLHFGPIDDEDITWVNGTIVGKDDKWFAPRTYEIPQGIIIKGRNVITVRVLDYGGPGGICGSPENMKLEAKTETQTDSLPLAGDWKYKLGVDLKGFPPRPAPPDSYHLLPSVLYNAMIAPLMPYGIRGIIWYQGESNAQRAYEYRTLFPAMIRDWRKNWAQGDFPFLFVQLANYMPVKPEPGEDEWAELREAQVLALSVPRTAMAVTIDIGDANDIHPRNKQELGNRLALAARAIAYGEKIEYSGPIYREGSLKKEDGKIRLRFDHVGGGLVAKGPELKGFSIAGEDEKFVWAKAKIENDSVIVRSDKVPQPLAVRYAWAINPECNLYNKEGLPASPFRTDDWPGLTQK